MCKMEYSVIFVFTFVVSYVRPECLLSLKEDFGSPAPVLLHNSSLLAPTTDGHVALRRADTITAACPGRGKFVVLGDQLTEYTTISLQCVSATNFKDPASGWSGTLEQVRCSAPPWYQAVPTGRLCHSRNKMYRVGYNVSNTFYPLYELCFDHGRLTTLFSKYQLSPGSYYGQIAKRPAFIEGGLFGKVSMSRLYKVEHQRSRLRDILGEGMEHRYITQQEFLNRGHLAAKADFPMSAEQRGTFHYANAAPQWMRGNAGDWAALEEAVRRRVRARNATRAVAVYTGTFGVCTLADNRGVQRPVYLATDENNNEVVPVPLYLYKIVHDPSDSSATVFISINSPYYNESTLEQLSFCQDVCSGDSRFSWLRWRNDGTHSFCCEYRDFAKTINVIPKIKVNGLFY
ncbi:uncharacterized protein LOC126967025 [Leptidea sinapis]|uniref:uncharacterized protein LOC126967025 n=1 Tax=Leptidea sinapis TaxID=189913 RepID=UPI002133461C|nr:uncharacterized protein LOC126967025 [Leptidea sinapis]